MTKCPPGCGACCDPVRLRFRPEDMDGPSGPFARANWTVTGQFRREEVQFYEVTCAKFDAATRACTAYADRPPICSGYPWYGLQLELLDESQRDTVRRERELDPVCAYHADVRTVLPLTVVARGR